MSKEIVFEFRPAPKPPVSIEARYLVNVREGIDVEMLRSFLLSKMPSVAIETATTRYHVLFTRRYEKSPYNPPDLEALVEVRCTGSDSSSQHEVEGLYRVKIFSDAGLSIITATYLDKRAEGEISVSTHPLPPARYINSSVAAAI